MYSKSQAWKEIRLSSRNASKDGWKHTASIFADRMLSDRIRLDGITGDRAVHADRVRADPSADTFQKLSTQIHSDRTPSDSDHGVRWYRPHT